MARKAGESLRGQAETFLAAAEAAARWFRRPAPSALSAARTARLRAHGWRQEAVAALRPLRGAVKTDAADFSFALREAVEHAVQAVSEAARYGVEADPGLVEAADALREAAGALARAAAAKDPSARAESAIEAKRWAASAERARRAVRAQAHEDPSLARALKRETVAGRLSASAESVQLACDALAAAEAA